MDGVSLAVVTPALRSVIVGRRCGRPGWIERSVLQLPLRDFLLRLIWDPSSPGLEWLPAQGASPGQILSAPPVWRHHLEGRVVSGVDQPGLDRILIIRLSPARNDSGLALVFEMTGRNANIILHRPAPDLRVVACARRVTPGLSRYRTILPGERYRPPPPSGRSLEEWERTGLLDTGSSGPSPTEMCRGLEGVGPATARAVLEEARLRGEHPSLVLRRLRDALLEGDLHPWLGPEGLLPISMGKGKPVENTLSALLSASAAERADSHPMRDRLERRLAAEISKQSRLLARVEQAIEMSRDPETLRLWADLLKTRPGAGRRRGLSEIRVTDWGGAQHTIPLRPSRTLVENAERLYRKARNVDREREMLASRADRLRESVSLLEGRLEELPGMTEEEAASILSSRAAAETGRDRRESNAPGRLVMIEGWRCFIGRNASENDRISFGLARRGDMWLHARGKTGPHVLVKRDGRKEPPPEAVLLRAAALAAKRSGAAGSDVVAVDVTDARFLRRMRGGKPGEVLYSNERTLFVDLER
ncbi:DUF814 domain-containing protein [Candidatus Fermentibacterales bacterium]|nr:DUF814 domain-containing protein [Candidatus Fermentibacterales bacterium]